MAARRSSMRFDRETIKCQRRLAMHSLTSSITLEKSKVLNCGKFCSLVMASEKQ